MIPLAYLLIINAAGLLIMRADKRKAIAHQYRISEVTLLLIAVCGGSIGCYWGMKIYRHKTKKPLFFIGIPVIISLQILISILFICFL